MTRTGGAVFIDWSLPVGFRLRTQRLELVPAEPNMVNAAGLEPSRLSELLDARVPDSWPPESVDSQGSSEGWWDWYALRRDDNGAVVIGVMGVKGWPLVSKSVQMGCTFLPEYQAQRYGTEAFGALSDWALSQPDVEQVSAEVNVGNAAAIGVLKRLGFSQLPNDQDGFLIFQRRRNQS